MYVFIHDHMHVYIYLCPPNLESSTQQCPQKIKKIKISWDPKLRADLYLYVYIHICILLCMYEYVY